MTDAELDNMSTRGTPLERRAAAEITRLRAAIAGAIEAIERGSTSSPVLECLKAAITAGKLGT